LQTTAERSNEVLERLDGQFMNFAVLRVRGELDRADDGLADQRE
jgi:hypothetical protein